MESNYSDLAAWTMKQQPNPNVGSTDHLGVFLKMSTDVGNNKTVLGGGGVWCKKHPKHYQSPGVCSCCLREKLSVHINTSSSSSSSSTSSLFYSTSSSENVSLPITMIQEAEQTHGRGDDSGVNGGGAAGEELGLDDGKDVIKRSHSSGGHENRKKKVGRFLLKFLRPTSKKCGRVLMMHSKTMTEPRSKRFY